MNDKNRDLLILIVDDTSRNLQVLGAMLKEAGYRIALAQSGQQALEAAQKTPPDLILLDVIMPELDGFETCKQLKENPSTREIPVIFLTARIEIEDIVKGFELGAVDYVTKPFNATELLARVESHLGRILLQRALTQRVEEIGRMKREHEAFLRHELRNRIAPIMGYSQMLSDLDEHEWRDTGQKWATTIFESSKSMTELIDAMKQLQDFEAGRFQLDKHRIEIEKLVQLAIAGLKAVYENQVEIHCENRLTNGSVEADENLLIGVFQNLIKNGIEHVVDLESETERRTNVSIYNESDQIVVEVNNGGEPISSERLASFFEKFNTDRKGQGTGLGTTYAYLVTKAHGGEISVTSSEADGTTVTVKLPEACAQSDFR